jgi:hypothetical protein
MKKDECVNLDSYHSTAPVFVIGMPRSGTTVISEAISVHEDLGWLSNYSSQLPGLPVVAFLSRIIDIPYIGHNLRGKKKQNSSTISSMRRFLPFSAEAYPVWNRYCRDDFAIEYLKNIEASAIEKMRVGTLVSKILRYQGKKRFFAKFTGPPRIQYLNSIFPDAYFIHVIRDPRANISSLLKVSFWRQNQGYTTPWWKNGLSMEAISEWESFNRCPVALSAIQWREIIETAWKEKELISKHRYLEILYEDFVSEPLHVLRKILNKVELKDSKNVLRYSSSIGKVHDMNYKFKANLNHEEISLIEKITLITAGKAGYRFPA